MGNNGETVVETVADFIFLGSKITVDGDCSHQIKRRGKKVKMAAARAGVLGVRWLQKAARNVVPLGARTASHITKDMLPGPYPKTPEERAAAAKKYNMRVEDYEPYPDDGTGWDRVCSHPGSNGRSSDWVGGSSLSLFPEPFRDPSESVVWVLFSVERGGRGRVSSCRREDFNFLLGSGCFLRWGSWGF